MSFAVLVHVFVGFSKNHDVLLVAYAGAWTTTRTFPAPSAEIVTSKRLTVRSSDVESTDIDNTTPQHNEQEQTPTNRKTVPEKYWGRAALDAQCTMEQAKTNKRWIKGLLPAATYAVQVCWVFGYSPSLSAFFFF